jgi:hypothetical protein
LTVEICDEAKLGFGATVCLRLVEDFLRNLARENLGRAGVLQDLVLAEREKRFEDILGEREAKDELLPWEEGPIEDARKAL